MFTVEWNRAVWDIEYAWHAGGDEWSGAWGGVDMQWYRTLLPRLHAYLPAGTILEIAPGFGRWTQKLKDHCQTLHLVDLAPRCIEMCRQRFRGLNHLHYHVNDGRSLPMIADDSIDFVFSFDSLVHVDRATLRGYLVELARVLAPDGVAFLHHSNLGEARRLLRLLDCLPFAATLERWGLIERNRHYRAPDVSAATVADDARQAGLCSISQEQINWGGRRLNDCFSVLTRSSSRWSRANHVVRNHRFAAEAAEAASLAALYHPRNAAAHS